MAQQRKQIQAFQDKMYRKLGNRILNKQHKGRRIDKAFKASTSLHRSWIYVGELSIALVLSFSTLIFGTGNSTPNNQGLVYPLQEVSTLECRTQEWNTLTSECKKILPIIRGANYSAYEQNKEYTDIYTVLFGGNYTEGWKTELGSHYGVDIASSKGTPLYAIADGKVYFAGQKPGYGNVVQLEFVYQGVRYFAIYGHMDTLQVKTGQTVTRGQKIGTVGNSGGTMGGLGGYHVHFEIDKGDKGRPIYPFFGCADLKKGDTAIINQGLCRTEMFAYAVDPIALLESANAKLPHPLQDPANSQEHAAPELKANLADREQILRLAKLYLDSPYQLGATGVLPGNPTDCSKFTQNVFSNAGIELERSASDQAHQFSNGGYWYDNSDKAELGDLLFFKGTYTPGDGREITHVGIYAGNNMMIHAGTEKVEMTPLHGYWKEHFKGVGSFKYLASKFNPEKARQNYRRLTQTSQTDGLPSTPSSSASPLPPSPPTTPQSEEPIHPSAPSLIPLESNNLDAIGRQFFSEWNIKLEGDSTSPLKKGESRIFMLTIEKENGDQFNGILKQPILLVPNTTNIALDPVAISLVKAGKVKITLTANQTGTVYIAINMGTNRMGGFSLQIQ